MEINREKLPYIFTILIAILIIIIIIVSLTGDKKGPMITVGYTDVVYTPGMDTKILLEGVSAKDKKDGDVTSTLMIDSITVNEENKTAKVIYAAKDKDGNITFAYKVIKYNFDGSNIPNEKPTIGNTEEPTSGNTEEPTSGSTQEPTKKPEDPTEKPTKPPVATGAKPVITLKQGSVTVKKGESIRNLIWYVENITDDKDDRNDLYTRIYIDGMNSYDLNTVGTYKLYYYTKDSDNNYSDKVLFEIHVVE